MSRQNPHCFFQEKNHLHMNSLSFLKIVQASATVFFWYQGCLLEGHSGGQPSVRGHYSPLFIGRIREKTVPQSKANDGRRSQPKELTSNEPGFHSSSLSLHSLLTHGCPLQPWAAFGTSDFSTRRGSLMSAWCGGNHRDLGETMPRVLEGTHCSRSSCSICTDHTPRSQCSLYRYTFNIFQRQMIPDGGHMGSISISSIYPSLLPRPAFSLADAGAGTAGMGGSLLGSCARACGRWEGR